MEPTGPFEDDPNVTNKRFRGNPTKSYRSKHPLRIVAEVQESGAPDSSSELLARARAEITPLFAEMTAAANAHDTDRHLAAYVKSPDLIFVVNDELIPGFDSLRVRQRQWWRDGKSDVAYQVVGEPMYRMVAPGLVVQSYFLKSERSAPGGARTVSSFGITAVWQKRLEGWRIVHAHESVVTK